MYHTVCTQPAKQQTAAALVAVAIMMGPEDEYDIRDSFHVMDEQKTGEISVDEFHTLCLGLGYNLEREELDSSIRQQTLSTLNQHNCINVDIALVILSKVRLIF
jgi:Ca2+-binding EF-hand superfamily protein